MLDFLIKYQLNIMLILSGICVVIVVFSAFTTSLSNRRKSSLFLMELGAALLLIFDRFAYIYRGDISETGYWMVRVSNYMVFAMTLTVLHAFNVYLIDLYADEGGIDRSLKRLTLSNFLILIGQILIIVSQFTGFYYYFDESNRYVRGPGFIICYVIPIAILILQMSVILEYKDRLSKGIFISILLFSVIPIAASIIQFFIYGVSLTNMTIVGMVILLYLFAIIDMNERIESAQKREIQILQDEQKRLEALFEQTAGALVNSIDAKDKYTRGHSTRVADYSRRIAKLAGKSEVECQRIYYAALLHDVGKIGIHDQIINKEGRLTDEEFAEIKKHPAIGYEILSQITSFPYIREGAYYHHERYDGRGYPQGLKGDEIPEIGRIIAVADSYDAMTSKRSYRDSMSQETVRNEFVKCSGTQFDPKFAKIMVKMIDEDKDYKMREVSD